MFDDPRGAELRHAFYRRASNVCRFQNERELFADVHNNARYAISRDSLAGQANVDFWQIGNLYDPTTIDLSWQHDALGSVPGIKDENNQFELRGHRNRIVRIGERELSLFASLFDARGPRRLRLDCQSSTAEKS